MLIQPSDPGLSLREITEADEPLLLAIYASTREKEMTLVPQWSEAQKKAFLLQQFTAQHAWYRQHYKGAFFYLIQRGATTIGRLYVAPCYVDGTVRIIDIALLPAHRNKGYGESLLKDIMTFAKSEGRNLTIHVESFNPAMRLYERLGFLLKDRKNEVYYLLEWECQQQKLTA